MTPPSKQRRVLGRGLSALIPDAAAPAKVAVERPRDYFLAQIEDVYPSPEQPRKRFNEEELDELATSIEAHGVIQPIIVRERSEGGYFLIAGERRWRASQRAGLREVPVVIQKVTPADAFERALVENLQRSDLNAIEEAEAYKRLVSGEFGYTQEQVAERVGKDRATVANSLRLLKLPRAVRALVEDGSLSMGHARALLALETDPEIETAARTVVANGLSVRGDRSTRQEGARCPNGRGAKSARTAQKERLRARSRESPHAVARMPGGGVPKLARQRRQGRDQVRRSRRPRSPARATARPLI